MAFAQQVFLVAGGVLRVDNLSKADLPMSTRTCELVERSGSIGRITL
jgi:hypothetical protein